ncbi:flagellin FliC [Luteimonas fraxinea]|uniref:Flagellin n=1 Tax=Luteimonas fraxinea TaxID=2901869 RepID=A0ABS8U7B2_9GAMM|nr:flagellin [Luteimonas fraxinea]MCD9095573.1 flagellin FliC [Luteimonas fraxinea]MCD9126186.1 flagellin FliC [Luteimonas fraxinea]UHH11230.1 flagellin FliC [Luteimonas fraxinea]
MSQVINTNVMSLNAQRNLSASGNDLATSLQRLSSGLRINSAKDDAAGLAISQRMTSQIRGMDQAARNANDGISLAQTAEGALTSIGDNLQRIRELAVQAANGTNSDTDKTALQAEATQLSSEIARVLENTKFNDTKLFATTGTGASEVTIQVGANATENDQIKISLSNLATLFGAANTAAVAGTPGSPAIPAVPADPDATPPVVGSDAVDAVDAVPGTPGGINILDAGTIGANNVLTAVDGYLASVNSTRADLGAVQNRFSSVVSNLSVNSENLSAARSRIQDADFAKESAALTRNQILQQAGTAMLAQANQSSQNVLSLIR